MLHNQRVLFFAQTCELQDSVKLEMFQHFENHFLSQNFSKFATEYN